MTRWPALAISALAIFILASCSGGQRKAAFTLDGVSAPLQECTFNPQNFAQAERVPDFHLDNGCGVSNGYKVYTVNDVGLKPEALVTCEMADAMSTWLTTVVQPAAQSAYGQRVVSMKVAASYACRPRNNKYGAKLSEHGFGNAVDIASFTLADGREVSVARDTRGSAADQQFMHIVRDKACGLFNTVLGPGSDAEHGDHLHLDKMFLRKGRGRYCH